MTLVCRVVRLTAPSEGAPVDGVVRSRLGRHRSSCLRCQAETARYRRLRRSLAELEKITVAAPPSLEHAVAGSLDDRKPVRPVRRRGRVAAGLAATGTLVATAGTVAVVLWRRGRVAV